MVTVTQKEVKKREWTIPWIVIAVISNLTFIGYMIFGFIEGRKGNDKYITVYNLFRHPSWDSFKAWWAHMANDPWTDMLLMFVFMAVPIPFLPYHLHERIELLMAKLGLYSMLSAAILGKPNYNPDGGKWQGEGKTTYVLGWVFVGVLISFAAYSYICAEKKWLPQRFCI